MVLCGVASIHKGKVYESFVVVTSCHMVDEVRAYTGKAKKEEWSLITGQFRLVVLYFDFITTNENIES